MIQKLDIEKMLLDRISEEKDQNDLQEILDKAQEEVNKNIFAKVEKQPIYYDSLGFKGTKRKVIGLFCKPVGSIFEVTDEITCGLHLIACKFPDDDHSFYVLSDHILKNTKKV